MPIFIVLSIVLAILCVCELLILAELIFCVVAFLILGRSKEEIGIEPPWFAMFATAIIFAVLGYVPFIMWKSVKREIWPPTGDLKPASSGESSSEMASSEEPKTVDNGSSTAEVLDTEENKWLIHLAISKMLAAGVEANIASRVAQEIKPELVSHFNQGQQNFGWVVGFICSKMTAAGIDAGLSRRLANEMLPDIMVTIAILKGPIRPHSQS